MAKVLTKEVWKQYFKYPRRYVQREEDGEKIVLFKTPIYRIEPGEEDLSGYKWEGDWVKHEAEVIIDGERWIYSLGGEKSPLLRSLYDALARANIEPEEIANKKFKIKREGNRYTVELIKEESEEKQLSPVVQQIKDIIVAIKKENRYFFSTYLPESEFVTAIAIKSQLLGSPLSKEVIEKSLIELQSAGIIDRQDGKVRVT